MSVMSVIARRANVVNAAFFADAATMGLHWVYSQSELAELITSMNVNGAFFNPPISKYYDYESGKLSCYGDELLPLLDVLSQVGSFDAEQFAKKSHEFFSSYEGRLNHAPKGFCENMNSGKNCYECATEDFQANGIIKMPLMVAKYAGNPELLVFAKASVSMIQNSKLSEDSSELIALILERIIQNDESPEDAIRWFASAEGGAAVPASVKGFLRFANNDALILEWTNVKSNFPDFSLWAKALQYVVDADSVEVGLQTLLAATEDEKERSDITGIIQAVQADAMPAPEDGYSMQQRVASLGLSCALPGCLLATLHIALHSESLESAVMENITCGGDNCSRAIVLGGFFGGWSGAGDIPASWRESVNRDVFQRIEAQVTSMLQI
jgi:ADP-ribosylglycohydrolase